MHSKAQSVSGLLLDVHGIAVRLASGASGVHLQGLRLRERLLRQRLSANTRRRMIAVDSLCSRAACHTGELQLVIG